MPGLNEVLNRLRTFVEHLEQQRPHREHEFKFAEMILGRENDSLFLDAGDAQLYRGIVEDLYSTVQNRGIGKRNIENWTTDFIFASLRFSEVAVAESTAQLAMRELRAKLQQVPQDWQIQVSVGGLDPNGLPAKVGQVEFHVFDERREKEVTAQMLTTVDGSGSTAKTEEFIRDNLLRLRNTTVGVIHVNAVDFEAASEGAMKKLRITIDAVNFYNYRSGRSAWLYIPGEAHQTADMVLGLGHVPHFGHRRRGPERPIHIREITSQPAFQRISELLSQTEPSKLDQRLLAALQWAGRAQVDPRPEQSFLLFAISLESLILDKSTTELSHRLGVRCAHLGGGSIEEKKLVLKRIRELYEIRSRIVHSGSFQVTKEQLRLMQEYAMLSLFLVLDKDPFRSMRAVEELEDWFEICVLSSGELQK